MTLSIDQAWASRQPTLPECQTMTAAVQKAQNIFKPHRESRAFEIGQGSPPVFGPIASYRDIAHLLQGGGSNHLIVNNVATVLKSMGTRLTSFLDIVFKSTNPHTDALLLTEEGITFQRSFDEKQRPCYDMSWNGNKLCVYPKTAEKAKGQEYNYGGWQIESNIQTIELRGPGNDKVVLEEGSRPNSSLEYVKLLHFKNSDMWNKPSLDYVVERPNLQQFTSEFPSSIMARAA